MQRALRYLALVGLIATAAQPVCETPLGSELLARLVQTLLGLTSMSSTLHHASISAGNEWYWVAGECVGLNWLAGLLAACSPAHQLSQRRYLHAMYILILISLFFFVNAVRIALTIHLHIRGVSWDIVHTAGICCCIGTLVLFCLVKGIRETAQAKAKSC